MQARHVLQQVDLSARRADLAADGRQLARRALQLELELRTQNVDRFNSILVNYR